MDAGLRAIPGLLAQAKTNLTGNGRDLWIYGTKNLKQQSKELGDVRASYRVPRASRRTSSAAKQATDALTAWLDAQAPSKTGPSGIGIENYDWYLKHVQLVPLHVAGGGRAPGARARAFPGAARDGGDPRTRSSRRRPPIANADEYDRRFNAAASRSTWRS